jgi:hypothetical protein
MEEVDAACPMRQPPSAVHTGLGPAYTRTPVGRDSVHPQV